MTDDEFRRTVRDWLAYNLTGEFEALVRRGGPGREHELVTERLAWERRLGQGGWIGIGWPTADGGRGPPGRSRSSSTRSTRARARPGGSATSASSYSARAC